MTPAGDPRLSLRFVVADLADASEPDVGTTAPLAAFADEVDALGWALKRAETFAAMGDDPPTIVIVEPLEASRRLGRVIWRSDREELVSVPPRDGGRDDPTTL